MMQRLKFPDGFLWGAATSAHQVEGGNRNDWSEWEKAHAEKLAREAKTKYEKWQQEKFPEMFDSANYISGAAADHYNRYEEDFDIAKSLGHTAHRFSIEWSRIEPEEGKWNEEAIEHYRSVIKALRARGMEPFVTLWHWTNPAWTEKYGGWEGEKIPQLFIRYVDRVVSEFKNDVKFWLVFNEPNVFVGRGYIQCDRPPARKGFLRANRAIKSFSATHKKVYRLIHTLDPQASVVVSHFAVYMKPYQNSFLSKLIIPLLDYVRNWRFFNDLKGHFDCIGIQYYRVEHIKLVWWGGAWGPIVRLDLGNWKSDMEWAVDSAGMYQVLKKAATYKKPIFITENGISDAADRTRTEYIFQHLREVHRAVDSGIDVRGYFYWSLLDNFEWEQGFWPRFGLVEIDFKTQKRTIRPSAYEYAKICKENTLTIEE